MRAVYIFRGFSGGVFSLPMEFDGKRTWKSALLDAHVLACDIANEPVTFIICQHLGPKVAAFQSMDDLVVPIVTQAALELS